MLSTTSPVAKPVAWSARAAPQGSGPRPSGSKIGPGEVKRRPKAEGGAGTKPANGGSAFCSAGSSDLRSTGRRARASRLATVRGIDAAQPLRIGRRPHRRFEDGGKAGEELGLALGGGAGFAGVMRLGIGGLVTAEGFSHELPEVNSDGP